MAQTGTEERDGHILGPGPKRILALDGGGVRGIFALAFLERIESKLREVHGSAYRLCDRFDLIGGASSGSVIASGLALGMDVAELIHIYLDLSKDGFQGSRWHGGVFVPKFKTKPLLKSIRAQVGDETLGSAKLKTGLALVAKRLDTGSVWVFHNNPRGRYFGGDGQPGFTCNKDLPIAQLIRASTAAPTFFAPERIEVAPGVSGLFVDGGVSPHNNPALLLFMLATLNGYGFRWPTGCENLTLISVGTGHNALTPADMPTSWEPSAMLAVLGLYSVIEDSSWLVQTMLQWLGRCPSPWPIDSEIGDLAADQLGPQPLLHYERYDLELTREWLSRKVSLDISPKELKKLRSIDDPHYTRRMLEIGRMVAETQIPDDARF